MQGNSAIPGFNNGTIVYTPADGNTLSNLPAIIDDKKLPPSETLSNLPAVVDDKTVPQGKTYTTLPAIVSFHPTDEGELVEIDDDIELTILDKITGAAQDGEDSVKPKIIGDPTEITVGVTQEQQDTIDNIVEQFMNRFGEGEITDNTLYKDDNGNIKSQVIRQKNEDGTYSETTIKYNADGKIAEVSVQKFNSENAAVAKDGYWMTFDYRDDGTIAAQEHCGVKHESGVTMEVAVYYPPIVIGQDGISNSIYDFKPVN